MHAIPYSIRCPDCCLTCHKVLGQLCSRLWDLLLPLMLQH